MSKRLKKILYVEDDSCIAEIAKMTLEDLGGFEVKHCDCGQAALDALENDVPQLVLMDIMMPGMDGVETMLKMQQMPVGKNLPVIFMTAKAQTHEQQLYKEKGAVGVIVKPFDPTVLCDTINKIWEQYNQ